MRCTVASVAALAATIVVAISLWPENRPGPMLNQAVAQTNEKAKAETLEAADATHVDTFTAITSGKLDRFTEVHMDDIPLKDFLEWFANQFSVEFYIDRQSVQNAGVDLTAQLASINLSHVRGRMLLDLVLGERDLGFMIRDGIIFVGSKDKFNTELVIRVYDCRNILAHDVGRAAKSGDKPEKKSDEAARYDAVAPIERQASDNERPQIRFAQMASATKQSGSAPETSADRLIALIENTVQPATWDESGGPGSIGEYGGLLVVRTTEETHRQVADLLEQIENRLSARPAK